MEFRIPKESLATVKAFFSDIDGTLIDNHSQLHDTTRQAIASLKLPFSLVSGRSGRGLKKFYDLLSLTTPMLTLNGAIILQDGKVLYSDYLPQSDVRDILTLLWKKYGDAISLETYDATRWYANTLANPYLKYEAKVLGFNPDVVFADPHEISSLPMAKIMAIGESSACDAIEKDLAPFKERLQVIRNHDTYIEIFTQTASKGNAIRKASEILKVPLEQTLCAGDSPIDLSMFLTCPFRVAVRNADPIIKAHANIITESNDEDGIAKIIEAILEARH